MFSRVVGEEMLSTRQEMNTLPGPWTCRSGLNVWVSVTLWGASPETDHPCSGPWLLIGLRFSSRGVQLR